MRGCCEVVRAISLELIWQSLFVCMEVLVVREGLIHFK